MDDIFTLFLILLFYLASNPKIQIPKNELARPANANYSFSPELNLRGERIIVQSS